jgi:hypothetical protein
VPAVRVGAKSQEYHAIRETVSSGEDSYVYARFMLDPGCASRVARLVDHDDTYLFVIFIFGITHCRGKTRMFFALPRYRWIDMYFRQCANT